MSLFPFAPVPVVLLQGSQGQCAPSGWIEMVVKTDLNCLKQSQLSKYKLPGVSGFLELSGECSEWSVQIEERVICLFE